MKKQRGKKIVSRLHALIVALYLTLGSVTVLVSAATPAQAATGNILPPFNVGETWYICQGYGGPVSHTGTSQYGLDLTGGPNCDSSAAGRTVRAPAGGTVYYYQAAYGSMCINLLSGGSLTLTHIDRTFMGSTITAGQIVGTVAAAGQRGNRDVAHIHLQIWASPGCYGDSGIPFDTAHNTRICGAPDLTSNGPGGNGAWSGVSFKGESCGSGSNSSVVFTNGGGATYANADPAHNPWTQLSNSTNAISASGSYTAWIDGCGAAWATSNFASVSATQLTSCNGASKIAIGPNGNVIFVDGCGSAHATNTYTNSQSWVILTGCNGAAAVAAGGGSTGQVGVINMCGSLNVTTNYQNWTQTTPCGGAQQVSIGPNGTLAFTNGCGALNATVDYTNPAAWTQITGCNGTTKFAVGTDKRLVFIDSCGSVHGTMTYDVSSSWVILTGCNGAQAIAMGTEGKTGIINGCGSLNVTADFRSWTQITPCNGAQKIAIS